MTNPNNPNNTPEQPAKSPKKSLKQLIRSKLGMILGFGEEHKNRVEAFFAEDDEKTDKTAEATPEVPEEQAVTVEVLADPAAPATIDQQPGEVVKDDEGEVEWSDELEEGDEGKYVFLDLLDEMDEKGRAKQAFQTIFTLMHLLKQDRKVRYEHSESLLRQLGFNPENVEQLIQSFFRANIDEIGRLVNNDPTYTIMEGILKYKDPKNLTEAKLRKVEGGKKRAFKELLDAISPFKELKAYSIGLELSFLSNFLYEYNDSLSDLDKLTADEMQADFDLRMKRIEEPIERAKKKVQEYDLHLDTMESAGQEPSKPDLEHGNDLRERVAEAIAEVEKKRETEEEYQEEKRRAVQAVRNLKLSTPKDPIAFDEKRLEARLKALRLTKREVPSDFDWEPVLKDPNMPAYLQLLDKVRADIVRRGDTEVEDVLTELDKGDDSFLRSFFDELETPMQEIIFKHLFEGRNPTPTEITKRTKAVVDAIGEVIERETSAAGHVLHYLHNNKKTPADLQKELDANPNLIDELEAQYKAMAEGDDKVKADERLDALRTFAALRETAAKSGEAEWEIPDNFSWDEIRQDPVAAGWIERLEAARGSISKEMKVALLDEDFDGTLLEALEDKSNTKPVEVIILEEVQELHKQPEDELADALIEKISDIGSAISFLKSKAS